jgi:hypothetical protein
MPKGIYVRTKECREVLSKAHLGKVLSEQHKTNIRQSYVFEKYVTKQRNEKISLKLKGRTLSLKHRLNIGLAHKGKKKPPMTDEHRKNIGLAHKGKKSHWWRGGRTALAKAIKNTIEYKNWRKILFERDNYTCIWCKERGKELAPDHIKAFSVILSENNIKTVEEALNCRELWSLRNGRTLCRPCHKTTDTYGKKLITST